MHTSSRLVCIIFCCNAVLLPGDLKVAPLWDCTRDIQNTYFLHVSEQDGQVRELGYLQKEWTRRQNAAVREKNIQHPALMSMLPPLHIRSDEELRESHGPDFVSFLIPA